nr:hypothetical protein [Chthoniobacterales bacterium]
ASNLGSGADRDGRIAINIGTSAAVRVIENGARGRFPLGLFRYVVDAKRTLLGGAISNGGNLRRWSLRELRVEDDQVLSRRASATDLLDVLPFWVQERSPTWPEDIAGTVTGFTQSTTATELLRALTVSTFYRLAEILDLVAPKKGMEREVIVSGGILKSPPLVRILADAIGRDLQVSRVLESSIRGAAIHALEQLGAEVPPLRRGKIVKHSPALAEQHLLRRERQRALEELLSRQR